jgi:hypothetical protein
MSMSNATFTTQVVGTEASYGYASVYMEYNNDRTFIAATVTTYDGGHTFDIGTDTAVYESLSFDQAARLLIAKGMFRRDAEHVVLVAEANAQD